MATVSGARRDAQPVEPAETQERWQLAVERPERMRAAFQVGDRIVTMVQIGTTWWSWSPASPPTTNGGNPHHGHGTGPGGSLIEPAALLPAVDLDVTGRSAFLGRSVLEVSARPAAVGSGDEEASDREHALHFLGRGADDYVLLVDEERGTLLRVEAWLAGEPFQVIEMERIAFDEPLPPGTFDHPDAPEPVETHRYVALAVLPEAVAHAVLVPAHPPFGPPEASLNLREGSGEEIWDLSLDYRSHWDGEESQWFALTESAEPLPDRPGFEWHQHAGLRVTGDTSSDTAPRMARLERDGTHIEIRAQGLPMTQLLEMAQSLVRLPPSPPALLPRHS